MKHIVSAALVAALATSAAPAALAQTFSSALPLTAAERRAMEARLSTILDFGRTNEVHRFDLPEGGQVAVRTYRPIRRSGGQPCRGYRIDVDSAAGRSAVDGFRCRSEDGRAWLIVEPEILITSGSPPRDLRQGAEGQQAASGPLAGPGERDARTFAERLREQGFDPRDPGDAGATPPAGEPFDVARYAREERLAGRSPYGEDAAVDAGPPPVPSPRPDAPDVGFPAGEGSEGADVAAGQAPATEGAAAPEAAPSPTGAEARRPVDRAATARTVEARGTEASDQRDLDRGPPSQAATTSYASRDDRAERARAVELEASAPRPTGPEPTAAVDDDAARQVATGVGRAQPDEAQPAQPAPEGARDLEVAAVDAARIIDPRETAQASDRDAQEDDARIVAALRALDYLEPSDEAEGAVLQAAIDDFAIDERFALPLPPDRLIGRLNAALERSGALPVCTDGTDAMCIAP
ncbi:hypothetical protein [Acuticoccus sp.]|uniref:hypothetical protein n=1 Tax=Acuticoccus sp. TaxID=1904378 RepID=UPI003B523A89